MNKTVTINISGIIFNIDEGAYSTLKQYLESIKQKFGTTKGGEEILTDIEARIAEMFHEKVSDTKQVISQVDVNGVIAIMGQPEQFEDPEAEANTSYNNDTAHEEPRRGPRRFFRDPDSKIIGGVCSGVGHYFGIDPVIIRIIFVAIVFFGGSGVIAYLVLWAITPEAKTTSEKLQMKGQRVDIDSIRQSVSDEAGNLKKKFNHLGEKADEFGKQVDSGKVENFFTTLFNFILNIVKLVLTFVGKFFGILLIIFGGLFLLSLIGSLLGLGTMSGMINIGDANVFSLAEVYEFIFSSSYHRTAITIGLAIVCGIPVLAMLYGGIKILFGVKMPSSKIGAGVTLLWFAGIVLMLLTGFQIGKEFSKQDKVVSQFSLPPSTADTIIIDVNDELYPVDAEPEISDDYFVLKSYEDELFLTTVELDVIENQNDSISIKIIQEARGNSFDDAANRAENIVYSYSITNNRLTFDPFLIVKKEDLFRNQKVKIKVAIPQGKTVFLDKTSGWIIYDIKNTTRTRDRYMLNNYWTMTEDGLDCLNKDMSRNGIRARKKASRERASKKPVVPNYKANPNSTDSTKIDTSTTAAYVQKFSSVNTYPLFPTPFTVFG